MPGEKHENKEKCGVFYYINGVWIKRNLDPA